jgi:manganese transport protein
MGQWKNGWFLLLAGWGSAILITALDMYGIPDSCQQAWAVITGK